MLRILAIGNSFSEDATFFLHQILEKAGIENEVINLYIGGCPLERHWRNMETGERAYQFQKNGFKTDRYVSVGEVLKETRFDAIVTQQASGDSGWENTYEPFLGLMLAWLRQRSEAKIYLNQTWAYEQGSPHEHFMRYGRNQQQMFEALKQAYAHAAKRHALPLIRCGEAIQKVRALPAFAQDGLCITRDGFHMSFLYGRYTVALMWAAALSGMDPVSDDYVPEIDFVPGGERADEKLLNQIRRIAGELSGQGKAV